MATRVRTQAAELPCPRVRFEADFPRRLERFAERLSAAREGREGRGASGPVGAGHEFVGYRPYRAGEDLRALDWNLLARLDRPYVRVTQAEAGELWLVLLDTSASMGVGPPGKLQRAAEVSAAIACLALRLAAEVRLVDVGAGEDEHASPSLSIKKRAGLADLLAFLETRVARGRPDGRAAEERASARARAARIFVLSDFLSSTPAEVLPLARGGTDLTLVQILAPVEIDPGSSNDLQPELEGGVEWWEPESGAHLALSLDEHVCASYAVELERRIAVWRAACAGRRINHACSSTRLPFEDILRRALRGRSS